MSAFHVECRAGRGYLDLYYEDQWVAIDITERHKRIPTTYTEVFLDADDVGRLIDALTTMKKNIQERTKETTP
jgi:hypothetical protein